MKPGIQIGDTHSFDITVTEAMQAQFNTIVVHHLYSTASMITHMEWAARQHILPYLEEGEEGVGYHINIQHKSPTAIGETVTITSKVTEVNDNKITSKVTATTNGNLAGEGHITQAIIELKEFDQIIHSNSHSEGGLHPAVLWSDNLETTLSINLVDFYTKNVCTQYDESIISLGILSDKQTNTQVEHQGPFLIRFEIEELITHLENLLNGGISNYQTDFIEPILSLSISSHTERQFLVKITFSPPELEDKKSVECNVTRESLSQFKRILIHQLEHFPSLL